MAGIRQDIGYALRVLRGAPGFAAVAALTLGLGIGANAAMVGLFDALLTRPPEGVQDPERVVRVQAELPTLPGRPPTLSDALSLPQFDALRTRARGFAGMAAYGSSPMAVGEGDAARAEQVILASGSYFGTLGVRTALGRPIQPEDDRDGVANPVAVLSWQYWQRAYGGDPSVLGRVVTVAGQPLTIVGVAPRNFVGAELASPVLWVPLSLAPALGYDEQMIRSPFMSWLSVFGRLAPATELEQARATAQAALLAAEDEREGAPPPRMRGGATPGGARVMIRTGPGGPGGGELPPLPPPRVRLAGLGGVGEQGGGPGLGPAEPPVQTWYLAVTGLVLLIACANVANLLLARGAYRAHELAIRLSMGATPARIGRQLFTESVVLAALGTVIGFAVALVIWRLLPGIITLPPLPPLLDARTLGITGALTVLTVMLFGLMPLVGLRRPDIRGLLGRGAPSIAQRARGKSALVVMQLAMSVVLLIGAGLFIRSFQRVRTLDLGFAREQLLVVTADARGAGWTSEQAREFWEQAQERARRVPGVQGVATGANVPYMMRMAAPFAAASEALDPQEMESSSMDYVSPGFFATMGIRILEGRPFTEQDRQGTVPVAIVSRSFARAHFRGASPLGQCIHSPMSEQCVQVVGVAEDARLAELTDETPFFVYQPLEQRPAMAPPGRALHVRSTGDPAGLVAALRRELQAVRGPGVTLEIRSYGELLAPQLAPWRSAALLLGIFGAMGLLLAGVGLYGVVAFLVARRTREIGIRIALGADRRNILHAVLADAGRLVAVGAVLGLLLATAATRVFQSALYGVSALDPLVYLGTVVVLVGIALAAALSPARRATRVDPMVALRTE